jgi:DNA repair ATPase RecN
MNFFTSITPVITKWLIIGFSVILLLLSAYCGYLYFTKQTIEAKMETVQGELTQAKKDIDIQKGTIDQLQNDANVQANLMKQYQLSVSEIRKVAADSLTQIDSIDYGKEANSNAPELEKTLNDRMQVLFGNIEKSSRGN